MRRVLQYQAIFDKRFFYLILLNTCIFCYAFINSDFSVWNSLEYIFRSLCFNIGFLGLIVVVCSCLLGKKITSCIINILVVFTTIFILIEIFLLLQFGSIMQPIFMDIFLSTNINETREFLDFYVNANFFKFSNASYYIYMYAALIIFSILIFKMKIPSIKGSILLCFVGFGLCFSLNVGKFKNSNALYRLVVSLQEAKLQATRIAVAHKEFVHDNLESIKAMLEKNTTRNKKDDTPPPPIIVLIIGESTQRDYLSLYGFPLMTTPNLTRLQRSKNLFVFEDIVAPAPTTNASLQKVLSMSNYENDSVSWFLQFNIVDLLQAADYNVAWISNQFGSAMHESVATSVAKSANQALFTRNDGYDEEVLPLLDSLRHQNIDGKQAYILHLLGAHIDYKQRYPQQYSHFTAEDIKLLPSDYAPDQKEEAIKAQYLNALLYNDFVVYEIIKRFENENAIIFYLSDHGEEMYDFRKFAGHGRSDSRFTLEIPFMIYVTDRYKQLYAEKLDIIQNALHKPQMSDDFIYSFFGILGLYIDNFDDRRNIFSDKYDTERKRLIYGTDYDSVLKSQVR